MENNIGAIKLGHNAEFYKRTKYINIKYYIYIYIILLRA